jgi:aspartyl-tRNA(Asn)/glutamyl-tRNA(Gln) amidotransferase subunit B
MSYVDLNRSGVALMEIVSKPDMRSSDEAKAYLTKLRTILRYLGTCDGNMEKGSMRADVNVSVRKPGGRIRHALRDQERQLDPLHRPGHRVRGAPPDRHLEDGGTIDQETRLYDPDKGETRSMRSKEEAHDYRYFPDPDLLPLEFDQAFVDALKRTCRNCRTTRRRASSKELGLSPTTPRCWSPSGDRRLFRAGAEGPRRQAGRQLGHQRAVRRAQQGRQGY